MRPRTPAIALAALLALACGLGLAAAAGDGGEAGTSAAAASPRGDVRPRAPRVVPSAEAEEEEVAEGSDADEETAEAPDPPEPPRRVLRIVDGDGDPVGGVEVERVVAEGEKSDAPRTSTTSADGEASFLEQGEANRVSFFDGAETRAVELRDPRTEVVVRSLPTLLVSAVDARSGNALDPVRFHFGRAWTVLREAWTGGKRPALALSAAGTAACDVTIDMPAGYGGYRTASWSGPLALRAKSGRLVVPLFEATSRAFRAVDRDRVPLRGANVWRAWTESHGLLTRWTAELTFGGEPSPADGVLRVEGLPRIPFTRLSLGFRWRSDGEQSLYGEVASIDPCAAAADEPVVVVLSNGGSYRGPSGGALG